MYQDLYELNYRREQYQPELPGLPAEFMGVIIKTPYAFHEQLSKLLLAFADQLIKTGNAIKNTQVQLDKQETYKY
ncbi:hypothetical protein EG834_02395 [bacterium]|nr:hypothetical protein [bacterium]